MQSYRIIFDRTKSQNIVKQHFIWQFVWQKISVRSGKRSRSYVAEYKKIQVYKN
jgi:hypothetical protein